LKSHIRNKHGHLQELAESIVPSRRTKVGKPYQCPYADCPSGYTKKSDLLRHLREKHAVDTTRPQFVWVAEGPQQPNY